MPINLFFFRSFPICLNRPNETFCLYAFMPLCLLIWVLENLSRFRNAKSINTSYNKIENRKKKKLKKERFAYKEIYLQE